MASASSRSEEWLENHLGLVRGAWRGATPAGWSFDTSLSSHSVKDLLARVDRGEKTEYSRLADVGVSRGERNKCPVVPKSGMFLKVFFLAASRSCRSMGEGCKKDDPRGG